MNSTTTISQTISESMEAAKRELHHLESTMTPEQLTLHLHKEIYVRNGAIAKALETVELRLNNIEAKFKQEMESLEQRMENLENRM